MTEAIKTEQKNEVKVSHFQNLVVVHLDHAQEYLPFPAVGAVEIGGRMLMNAVEADKTVANTIIAMLEAVADHVYEANNQIKPSGGALKHELIERNRLKATQRFAVMLNSLRENKKYTNGQLAQTLVDAIFKIVY